MQKEGFKWLLNKCHFDNNERLTKKEKLSEKSNFLNLSVFLQDKKIDQIIKLFEAQTAYDFDALFSIIDKQYPGSFIKDINDAINHKPKSQKGEKKSDKPKPLGSNPLHRMKSNIHCYSLAQACLQYARNSGQLKKLPVSLRILEILEDPKKAVLEETTNALFNADEYDEASSKAWARMIFFAFREDKRLTRTVFEPFN